MTATNIASTTLVAATSAALAIQNYQIADSTRTHNAQIIQSLQRAARKHKLKPQECGVTTLDNGLLQDAGEIEVDAIALVNAFFSKGNLSPNSLVTYRAALQRYLVEHRSDPQCQRALQVLLAAIPVGNWAEMTQCPAKTRKRRKTRTIPFDDFGELRDALFDAQVMQKSFWAGRAVAWLDVGIVTGLRPIEWETVVWADAEMTTLRVTNAKSKVDLPGFMRKGKIKRTTEPEKRSAVPKTRDIPIPASYRPLVVRHLRMIVQAKMDGIDFAAYHKQVSQAIRRACQKKWGGKKKYTLYSLRRQFAANAADAFGVEVSSQMMGHSNPQNPAASAYGLACQAYARVGKGAQRRQTQSDAQQSAGASVVQRPAAPCKFLANREAKLAQAPSSARCRC